MEKRFYECVFIVRQDATPNQVETLANGLADVVRGLSGDVGKIEFVGLRNLAYRIKKNRKGHYVLMNLTAPAAAITEMERQMKLNEDVLRHLTVRVEELENGPSILVTQRNYRDDRRGGGRDFDDDSFDRDDMPQRKNESAESTEEVA